MIRPVNDGDERFIANIYNHYILDTVITFEEKTVSPNEIKQRIATVRSDGLPWLVAERGDEVVGYAYASQWRSRSAYRFATEWTVYLDPAVARQGLGQSLTGALLDDLMSKRVHTVIGVIALPNEASIALHEKFGFAKAAHLKEVGFKFERWIDVGYWQRML